MALILLALRVPVLAQQDKPLSDLQAAWKRVAQAGTYQFSAELSQTTASAGQVSDIGQTAQAEQYHIEGRRASGGDASAGADLEMTLWSNGGSALDFSKGVSIRVQGDKAYAKNGESAWQEINNFSGMFAPNNDLLGYLSAADQVEWLGAEVALGATLQHYRYTIDPTRFAAYMSEQMGAQARRKYALPASLEFDLSDSYEGMRGSGEIWLDAQGYPRRHVLDLRLPTDGTSLVLSHADMTFSGFPAHSASVTGASNAAGGLLAAFQGGLNQAAAVLAQFGPSLAMMTIFFVTILRWGSKRKVQAVLAVVVIISIVITPLVESSHVRAFAEETRADASETKARSEQTQMEKDLQAMQTSQRKTPDGALDILANDNGEDSDGDGITDVYEAFLNTNPYSINQLGQNTDVLQLAERGINLAELSQDDTADDDGDGLTNTEETLLGTASWSDDNDGDGLPDGHDTDGDGISDFDEVNGFAFNGKTWYTDPLEMDTNKDGLSDGLEWNSAERGHPTWDTDGDGIPDLFDPDNDNDGVPDRYDMSTAWAGTRAYSLDNPLTLALDGVQSDFVTFYDLQIRPTRDEYLRYAFNVLDWPSDQKGQMQDWDNQTYASVDPSLPANPNANGDLKLIPMLELRVSGGSSGLPLTATPPAFNTALQDRTGSGVSGILQFAQGSSGVEVSLSNMVIPANIKHYNLANYLYTGTCANLGRQISSETYFGSQSPYTARFVGSQLSGLVDGAHALVSYSDGYMGMNPINPYAEWSCADIPRLPQENGKFVDTQYLAGYGMTVNYATAQGEDKIIYAPLSLVTAEGRNNVAFQARLVLRPEAGGITTPMRASMVWVIQALMDSCASSDLSTCANLNSPQALHSYYSDFRLTGASVREDHGAEMAVIYEDIYHRMYNMYPARTLDRDDSLFLLAQALNQTFIAGRDCDSVDASNQCVGNGEPDMTLREAERRFESRTLQKPAPTQEERLGMPLGLFRVIRNNYQTIDEARAATLNVQPHLNDSVRRLPTDIEKHLAEPTLLFATTESYRSVNLDATALTGALDGDTDTLSLNLNGAALLTSNGMNWKPYMWDSNNAAWVNKPIDYQWKDLESKYFALNGDTVDPEERTGEVVFLRMFYTALYQGLSNIIKVDNKVISSTAMQSDKAMYSTYVKYSIQGGGGVVKFVIEQILAIMMQGIQSPLTMTRILKGLSAFALSQVKPAFDKFRDLINWFRADTWGAKRIGAGVAIGGLVLVAILGAIYAVTALLARYVFKADWAATSAAVITTGITVAVTLAMPLIGIAKAIYGMYQAGKSVLSATMTVLGGASSIIGSTLVGAVIGLAINIAVAWGVFFYQWAAGAVQPGSIAFNAALAGVMAQVTVAVLTFVLSLCVIGTILVAIVSAIDAILTMLCTGFNVKSACFTLSGSLTNFLTEAFYGVSLTINTSHVNLVVPNSLTVELRNNEQGYTLGNQFRVRVGIDSFIAQQMEKQPGQQKERMLLSADFFYNDKRLTSTAMNFAIDALPTIPTRDTQVYQFNQVTSVGPYTERYSSRDFTYYLYTGHLSNSVTSPWYPMTGTGLNQRFPSQLNIAYAFPGAECIAGFCSDYTFSGQKEGADLGLVYDVLPPTLDEFLNFNGWAGDSFLRQADPDGDGAHWSVDPDESTWDTDGDGLSDGYELDLRAGGINVSLQSADSDMDGLSDSQEIILGTNPGLADTDGDGLTDGQEVNGWTFTYAPGKTTLARSDPKNPDTDGDSLGDLLEYSLHTQDPTTYLLHPKAANLPSVELALAPSSGMYLKEDSRMEVHAPVRFSSQYGADTNLVGTVTITLPNTLVNNVADQVEIFDINIPADGQTDIVYGAGVRPVCPACQGEPIIGIASARFQGEVYRGATLLGSVSQMATTQLVFDDTPPSAAVTSISNGAILRGGSTVVIGGTATDRASGVEKVSVQLLHPGGRPEYHLDTRATGTDTWAYTLSLPTVEGAYQLCPYAADIVGHELEWMQATCTSFVVDSTPPSLSLTTADNTLTRATRDAQNRWTLPIEVAADSDAEKVEARITPFSGGWIPLNPIDGQAGHWAVTYPLAGVDTDGTRLVEPAQVFTVQVRATDPVGNVHTDTAAPAIQLRVDNDAPENTLIAPEPGRVETNAIGKINIPSPVTQLNRSNRLITGTVQETGAVQSGIQAMEVRLLSAEDGMAPGMWQLWYRNNSISRGDPQAVAETKDINFDWGDTSPAEGVNPDGFTADFQRSSLFFTSGEYVFTIAHTGGSTDPSKTDHSGTLLYIDNQLIGRLDGTESRGEFTATVSAGEHQVRLLYHHATGKAAVSMHVSSLETTWASALLDAHAPIDSSVGWQYQLPDVEGIYQIDLRGTDGLGNRNDDGESWMAWQGEIDTAAPRLNLTTEYLGYGQNAYTRYTLSVADFSLDEASLVSPCQVQSGDRSYYDTEWWRTHFPDEHRLQGIHSTCSVPGHAPESVELKACDKNGLCSQTSFTPSDPPNRRSLFWTENGGGVSSIQRLNLADRSVSPHLQAAAGEKWVDMSAIGAAGTLYLGDTSANGRIIRLDSTGARTNLWSDSGADPANDPDRVKAAGGNLYWLNHASARLWMANGDGSNAHSLSLSNVRAFDVDPGAGVIVAVVKGSDYISDMLVFLDLQGSRTGSISSGSGDINWYQIENISVDPVGKAMYLDANYNQRHWWGITRLPYPATFKQENVAISSGLQIVSQSAYDLLADPEAQKVYYLTNDVCYDYSAMKRYECYNIMRVNPDGSNPEKLATRPVDAQPYGLALLPNEAIVVHDVVVSLHANEQATGMLISATDANGLPLTYTLQSPPTRGWVTGLPNTPQTTKPSISYWLNSGGTAGQDQFTIRVSNGRGSQADLVVYVNILPPIVVDAVILSPKDGQVFSTLDPIRVRIGLQATHGARTAGLWASGKVVASTEFSLPYPTETVWEFDWTPDREGSFILSPTLLDANLSPDLSGTSKQITIRVDQGVSSLSIDSTVQSDPQRGNQWLIFTGDASDSSGVKSVEARFDGGSWYTTHYDPATEKWTVVSYFSQAPDNRTIHVEARVTDTSGNVFMQSVDRVVDLVPPAAVTASYTTAGSPLSLPATLRQTSVDLGMTWTESSDGSGIKGYWAGWTTSATPDQANLTFYAPDQRAHTQSVSSPSVVWSHLGIQANNGDILWQSAGPLVVDDLPTPDAILAPDLPGGMARDWIASGATRLGRLDFQTFSMTWNSTHLAFAWKARSQRYQNAFIYLDTGKAGGAREAYNPFNDGVTIHLPSDGRAMEADYAIWGKTDDTAVLLRWNGSAWESAGPVVNSFDYNTGWAAWVPLGDLGITNPSANPLDVVAFNTAVNQMVLDEVFPLGNPTNNPTRSETLRGLANLTLQQQYHWDNLAAGVTPNQGKEFTTRLSASLHGQSMGITDAYHYNTRYTIDQPAAFWIDANSDGLPDDSARYTTPQLLSPGTVTEYSLLVRNDDTEPVRGLTAHVELRGALALDDGQSADLTVGDLSSYEIRVVKFRVKTLENSGPSGEVRVSLTSPNLGVFDWLWGMLRVDSQRPTVSLTGLADNMYIPAWTSRFTGTMADNIGVNRIEARVDGITTSGCTPPDPLAATWACDFYTSGNSGVHTLQVRARDLTGSYSDWTAAVTVQVDPYAPYLWLDDAARDNLYTTIFRDSVPLAGTVDDEYKPDHVLICADEALTTGCVEAKTDAQGHWTAVLPLSGEQDMHGTPLYLAGFDQGGNRSEIRIEYYRSDRKAPALTVTQVETSLPQRPAEYALYAQPNVLTGTISDADTMASLEVKVDGPGGSTVYPVVPWNNNWSFGRYLALPGSYTLTVSAFDQAGNRTESDPYTLTIRPSADLSINLTASRDIVTTIPAEYDYILTAHNASANDAPQTVVQLYLPSGAQVVDSTCGGTFIDGRFNWSAGTLAAGADAVCNVSIQIPALQSGSLAALARISSDLEDLLSENDSSWLSLTAEVNNPPIAGLRGTQNGVYVAVEGSPVTLDAGASWDPDMGDSYSLTYAWDFDNDGLYNDAEGQGPYGAQATFTNHLDGPTSTTVGLRVSDARGASITTNVPVQVTNAAPVVELPADLWTVQGETETFTPQVTDPGISDTFTYTWTVRPQGGEATPFASTPVASHVFSQYGWNHVCLEVSDDDGGRGNDCMSVWVNNASPQANAGPDQTITEGQTAQFSGSFTDASPAEAHYCFWEFGDGTWSYCTADSGQPLPAISHSYPQDGVYTITLQVWDGYSPSTTDTMTLTVENAAPVVNAGEDVTINEGEQISFSGSASDAGPDDTLTTGWSFGDGMPDANGLNTQHRYTQNGSYTAVFSATDDHVTSSDMRLITVNNLPPSIDEFNFAVAGNHQDVTLTGKASDPGVLDTLTLSIDWADGSPLDTLSIGEDGTFTKTHSYATSDARDVILTLTDSDEAQIVKTYHLVLNATPVTGCIEDHHFEDRRVAPKDVVFECDFQDVDGATGDVYTLKYEVINTDTGEVEQHIQTHEFDSDWAYQQPHYEHHFADGGHYTLRLTVTDSFGSSSADEFHIYIPAGATVLVRPVQTRPAQVLTLKQVEDPTSYYEEGEEPPLVWTFDINEGTEVDFQGSITDASIDEPTYRDMVWTFFCVSTPAEHMWDEFPGDLTYTFSFEDNCYDYELTPEDPDYFKYKFRPTLRVVRNNDNEWFYSEELNVNVINVAPSLSNIVTNLPIAKGMSLTLDADLVEPGTRDTVDVDVDWGDGTPHLIEHRNAPASGEVSWQHIYASAGNYTLKVTLTDKDGGVTTHTLEVAVPDSPLAARAGDDVTALEGQSVSFSGSYQNLVAGGSYTYHWDFGDGTTATEANTTHHYIQDGTYQAVLTVNDGLGHTATDTRVITVSNVNPSLGSPQLTTPVAEGTQASLTLTAVDPGAQDTLTLVVNWGDETTQTFNNVTGALAYPHTYKDNASYTVSLLLTDGEGGEAHASLPITVTNAAPTASFSMSGPYLVNEMVSFSGAASDPGVIDTLTYRWAMGDGKEYTTLNADHVFTSLGDKTVTFTVTDKDGASVTATQTIKVVSAKPLVSAGLDRSALEGQSIAFQGRAPANTDLVWDFGDGTQASYTSDQSGGLTPSHVYNADGAFTVTLTATTVDGISASSSLMVTVANAAPDLTGITSNSPIGSSDPLVLDLAFSDPGSNDPLTLLVDWGDNQAQTYNYSAGTTSARITHSYNPVTSGELRLTLTLSDNGGGSVTRTQSVTLNRPAVSLSLTGPDEAVKEAQSAQFSATVTNPVSGDPTTITWDFGDGATQKGGLTASHTYAAAGSYTVSLRAEGQIAQAAQRALTVTVTDSPPTISNANITASLVEGEQATLTLTAADVSPDPTLTMTVDWGDGSVQDYSVTLASLRYTHTYADNGSYTVVITLRDQAGGSATSTLNLTVSNAAPSVTLQGPALIELGQPAAFEAQVSDPGVNDSFTYLWQMGDGQEYSTPTANHSYAALGEYTVHLTVTDNAGASASATTTVKVQSAPVPVEAGEDASSVEGQPVSFAGLVNNGTDTTDLSLRWDFGDGLSATNVLAPVHTYADNGLYIVTLTVTTVDGVVSADTLLVEVSNAAPRLTQLTANPDNAELARGGTLTLNANFSDDGSEDPLVLVTDWGDGVVETTRYAAGVTSAELQHTYAAQWVGNLSASVTLKDNDDAADVKDIAVKLNPVNLSAELGDHLTSQEGAAVSFNAQVTNPLSADTVTLTWDFGDGTGVSYNLTQAGALTPSHTYAEDGIYTVQLNVTGKWSTAASDTLTVTVADVAPNLANVTPTTGADEGALVTFRATVVDPGTYDRVALTLNWGDGTEESVTNARGLFTRSHRYGDNGSYTVQVALLSDGSSAAYSYPITIDNVAPTPLLNLPGQVQFGAPFTNTGSAHDPGHNEALQFHWDMGDGVDGGATTYDTQTITHTYASVGTYTVSLTVTDKDGASNTVTTKVQAVERLVVVEAGPNQEVKEGQTVAFAATLDGQTTFDGFTVVWDFGDGSIIGGTLAPTHIYKNEGTYQVVLKVTNVNEVDVFTDSLTVTVSNQAPVIGSVRADQITSSFGTVSFVLPVDDAGDDALTLEITWNDGSATEHISLPGGTHQVPLSHTYPLSISGTVTIHLRLEDDAGAVAESEVVVNVEKVHLFYLPMIWR